MKTYTNVHKGSIAVDGTSVHDNIWPHNFWRANIIIHRGAINGDRAFVYNVKAHNADDFGR